MPVVSKPESKTQGTRDKIVEPLSRVAANKTRMEAAEAQSTKYSIPLQRIYSLTYKCPKA